MNHRFSSWWRALGVVLLSLATLTWPSASGAGSTPRFDIVHQNALTSLTALGTSTFTTDVAISPVNATTKASVAIYPALVTRSQIEPIVQGTGVAGRPLSATGDFDLGCVKDGVASFGITLYTDRPTRRAKRCGVVAPRLHLVCSSVGCGGVYPLRYTLEVDGTKLTKWSLLAVQSASIERPLKVNLIATMSASTLRHPAGSLATLDAFARYPTLPLTLSANYEALGDMILGGAEATWHDALDSALISPLHRVVTSPPKGIDFTGLAANHLMTQVTQQFVLASNLVRTLTGHYSDDPVVVNGNQTPLGLSALERAGFNEVVLAEDDLAVAPSSTLTWGAPFRVSGVRGITALSVDGPLSSLVVDRAIEPGRRAALALATLAFLHYEAPYAPATRTVVIEAPLGGLSKTFVNDFVGGLAHDAFSRLAALSGSFDSALIGTNGAPTTRALATGAARSTWSSHNVTSLLTLIGAVNSYAQGVRSGDVAIALRVAVAKAELRGSPQLRQSAIDDANNKLDAQLAQFSIDQSSITLAGPGGAVPITVLSRLHYTVDAVVHLVTNQMTFPKGNTVAVTLNSPTQSIRVPANPKGGSLTLQVLLTTPNGQVVLARTAIQVHVAGTSVVGYLLTLASLLVLGLWWWRTSRRRRPKARHAR